MKKICNHMNIKLMVEKYKTGEEMTCCERCQLLQKFLKPIDNIIDIEKNNIVIAKNNELYLIVQVTNTVNLDIYDQVEKITDMVICVHLTQNMTNMLNDPYINKIDNTLHRTLKLNTHCYEYLTPDDLLFVIGHSRAKLNNKALMGQEFQSLDLKNIYNIPKVFDILENRIVDNKLFENFEYGDDFYIV